MHDTNIIKIPKFFGEKIKTRYLIGPEGISVINASENKTSLFIAAESISAFRLGVKFTRGYRFYIGRKYWIEIKHSDDKILRIALDSYYRIKRKAYEEAWRGIFNLVWQHYAPGILTKYIEAFNAKKEFELGGFNFEADGIRLDKNTKIFRSEIAMSKYRTYFMIYLKSNPKIHRSCTFAIDWNGYVAQEFFKRLLDANKSLNG